MREELEAMLNTLVQQTNNYMNYLQPYRLYCGCKFSAAEPKTWVFQFLPDTKKITAVQHMA